MQIVREETSEFRLRTVDLDALSAVKWRWEGRVGTPVGSLEGTTSIQMGQFETGLL